MDLGTAVPLGEGAMGRVLRAYDEELRRDVAVKILRHDDPAAVERFLREARAQARVDHPNVARVYDVGYRDGRPCIVMQLVAGEPLDAALRERTLEEKVRVVRSVAEAIHAAHEAGLVHRDLKPGNILVEEDPDGEPVPRVVDFGIARRLAPREDAPGLTVTGQALGTPGYMSPEQARGDLAALDRRSDVFGLGVVLYELLAGVHPFADDSQVGALVRVLQEEAPPLGRVAPDLPVDLRAVVERCLEKDPNRRYPSARALAEDLGRWLRGEPVTARPIGVSGRLWRRVRRHPVAASLIGVALALALILGLWALAAELRTARRVRLAAELGERAKTVEARMRFAHLAPTHDVRAGRERVGRLVEELRRGLDGASSFERGPRALATGRGFLALGRWEEARNVLEPAWQEGYREPAMALTLGRALAEGFRVARQEAVMLGDRAAREARVAEARSRFAVPAREMLTRVTEGGLRFLPHERAYLAALLAFLRGELESAAGLAAEASAAESWFYEGDLLRAEALLTRAVEAQGRGERAVGRESLATARSAAGAAGDIARSDPRPHALACRIEVWAMFQARAEGAEPDAPYGRAHRACEHALSIDPDHVPAHVLLADASWRMGKALAQRGEDPEPALRRAVEAARAGLALVPDHPRLLAHRGNVEWVRGTWAYDHGAPWEPHLRRALADLRAAAEAAPGDASLWLSLGHAWNRLGSRLAISGGDASAAHVAALDAYERGLDAPGALESRLANGVCQLLGNVGYGRQLRGEDPTAAYARGQRACRRALAVDPGYLAPRTGLGLILWSEALWDAQEGSARPETVEEELEAAEKAFREVLARDPDRASAHLNLASTLLDHAASRLDRGQPPGDLIDRAAAHVEPVRAVYPPEGTGLEARVVLLSARRLAGDSGAADRTSDPRQLFEEAARTAREALELQGESRLFRVTELAALRHQAAWLLREGRVGEARTVARRGLARARAAAEIHPEMVAVRRHEAYLEALASGGS
ncbi:MAG: serine/threonine-protein kinase [Acidobacteriota bacterium]|jgi:tetratricopeptide (TPR) repeat protein/predicted Ser/Thr protein kinase